MKRTQAQQQEPRWKSNGTYTTTSPPSSWTAAYQQQQQQQHHHNKQPKTFQRQIPQQQFPSNGNRHNSREESSEQVLPLCSVCCSADTVQLKISGPTAKNPNREFYNCTKQDCNTFLWADEFTGSESLQANKSRGGGKTGGGGGGWYTKKAQQSNEDLIYETVLEIKELVQWLIKDNEKCKEHLGNVKQDEVEGGEDQEKS